MLQCAVVCIIVLSYTSHNTNGCCRPVPHVCQPIAPLLSRQTMACQSSSSYLLHTIRMILSITYNYYAVRYSLAKHDRLDISPFGYEVNQRLTIYSPSQIVHYPAGVLNVLVNKATSLQFPRGHYAGGSAVQKRIDPYVVLSLPGKAVNMVEKTSADKVLCVSHVPIVCMPFGGY